MSSLITVERFMQKPLFVDAVKVTAENIAAVAVWCDGTIETQVVNGKAVLYIAVDTLKPSRPRLGKAYVNDWVVKSEKGMKVYTPHAFEQCFIDVMEPLDEDDPEYKIYAQMMAEQNLVRVFTGMEEVARVEETYDEDLGEESGPTEREGVEEEPASPAEEVHA